MDFLWTPEQWAALATLAALEIVLGVDNLVFISIAVARLRPEQRPAARRFGLALACGTRIMLLLSLAWLASMTAPVVSVAGHDFSVRDLVLLFGGLFLLVKGTLEIHSTIEPESSGDGTGRRASAVFAWVIVQIAIIDIVFSLDSVITAVGMSNDIPIMVTAILIAVAIMLLAANTVGDFIDRHPTIRMLGLSFLILIGMALVADGLGYHISREYLYFAIAFSAGVETLNMLARKRARREFENAG